MAKAKKAAKKAPAKKAVVTVNPAIVTYAKGLKAKDQNVCEIIRGVSSKFKNARRIEIEKSLVSGMRMNVGTVRRQIQIDRGAA